MAPSRDGTRLCVLEAARGPPGQHVVSGQLCRAQFLDVRSKPPAGVSVDHAELRKPYLGRAHSPCTTLYPPARLERHGSNQRDHHRTPLHTAKGPAEARGFPPRLRKAPPRYPRQSVRGACDNPTTYRSRRERGCAGKITASSIPSNVVSRGSRPKSDQR